MRRVVLCSGAIYYHLSNARRQRKIRDIALVRLEQLAPFPHDLLVEVQISDIIYKRILQSIFLVVVPLPTASNDYTCYAPALCLRQATWQVKIALHSNEGHLGLCQELRVFCCCALHLCEYHWAASICHKISLHCCRLSSNTRMGSMLRLYGHKRSPKIRCTPYLPHAHDTDSQAKYSHFLCLVGNK